MANIKETKLMEFCSNCKIIEEFEPHQTPKTHHFLNCKAMIVHTTIYSPHMSKKKMGGNDILIGSQLFFHPISRKIISTNVIFDYHISLKSVYCWPSDHNQIFNCNFGQLTIDHWEKTSPPKFWSTKLGQPYHKLKWVTNNSI
jgi:hypothetical protein